MTTEGAQYQVPRAEQIAYPRQNDQGETVWACCESSIGPTCQHMRTPADDESERRNDWLSCRTCDGTGVVYAAGPDYFGNYDSKDCPTCSGYGAVGPSPTAAKRQRR